MIAPHRVKDTVDDNVADDNAQTQGRNDDET
jgi:hypothetical protein